MEEKQEELQCIVCRQEQTEQLLCLVWMEQSKVFSGKAGLKRPFLYFKGCMHPIHSSCAQKPLQRCPLCKKPANLLLPHPKLKYDPNSYKEIMAAIGLIAKIPLNSNQLFSHIVESFVELVSFSVYD